MNLSENINRTWPVEIENSNLFNIFNKTETTLVSEFIKPENNSQIENFGLKLDNAISRDYNELGTGLIK